METLLSTKQLQELLNIDRTTVYRMLKDGRLTGVKVGNQWRFSREEVDTLLSGNSASKGEISTKKSRVSLPVETVPLRCIQAMQDVFAEILGVGAVTTNLAGDPITMISNSCRFCHLILASESGQQACYESWRKLAQQSTDEIKFTTCHAGLQYARAQISIKDEFDAIFVAGQFYAEKPSPAEEDERLQALANKHQLNLLQLKSAAQTLPVLNEQAQAHIGDWLRMQARTFEEIGQERLDLIDRLQNMNLHNSR